MKAPDTYCPVCAVTARAIAYLVQAGMLEDATQEELSAALCCVGTAFADEMKEQPRLANALQSIAGHTH